eukprot:6547268-Prorocentrum_lima.AAC.1
MEAQDQQFPVSCHNANVALDLPVAFCHAVSSLHAKCSASIRTLEPQNGVQHKLSVVIGAR